MTLTELLTKGKQILEGKKIGFSIQAVETGWVWKNNRAVMEQYAFRQKAINAPAQADISCEFLGVPLKVPVVMSAMTMPIPAMADDGLLQVARGLKEAGSLMWTGTPIPKDIAALLETGVPLVVSAKPYAQREKLLAEIEQAQEQGAAMISLEVDAGQGTKIQDQPMATGCAPLSLEELKQIRGLVKGKLIMKGVLSAHDIELCLQAGADALVASNHGAHTIDYLPHPFQVAGELTQALAGRAPLVMDGGFRRGTDVLKGLALGADLVGLGRPILYALAAGGAEGVCDLVSQIGAELARTMTLLGAVNLSGIDESCVMKL